ncbi:alpha/beta hydrolase family protein [Rhizoctonia solani]|uniref:Alpha/beta hydrolase family protein n=1 Tax=Rhizoctonia solani TaxID=456999 RepID=A0A8H8P7F3_9AGAM|nr:alpha/beta hydrolase family protein [Rhizoctonia solani]QRW25236.1 alpha/beta hydrolase family protein [Rhizoctonia solani]
MFISSTLVAGISLATAASAAPTLESRGFFDFFFPTSNSPSTTGTCTQSRVPISVQVDTTAISMGKPVNQGDLTGFLAEYWATGSTVASKVTTSNADGTTQKRRIQGTYNIWSQVCHPKGVQGQVPLIIGIHGINFDHSYWEFGYSKEYNFIEAANKAGYAVLTYDRLGVGQSDKPDGVNIVQSSTEVEILHQFIQQSRASGKYSKISGIGHSFGSIQLTGIAARYPSDLDAVILTGFAPSMVSVPLAFTAWSQTLASDQADTAIRSRWSSLPGGSSVMNDKSYMGTGSPSSDRFAFFAKGAYDEGAFKQAYNTKQTHTLGEFLTIGEPISKPATDYKGHVFVVTGEKDIIFCGGNCLQKSTTGSGSSLLDDTKPLYPNAASFSTYVTPGAGHALFTHYGTAETISAILSWCKSS